MASTARPASRMVDRPANRTDVSSFWKIPKTLQSCQRSRSPVQTMAGKSMKRHPRPHRSKRAGGNITRRRCSCLSCLPQNPTVWHFAQCRIFIGLHLMVEPRDGYFGYVIDNYLRASWSSISTPSEMLLADNTSRYRADDSG